MSYIADETNQQEGFRSRDEIQTRTSSQTKVLEADIKAVSDEVDGEGAKAV